MIHDLWVERYRPDTLEGYVFKDPSMKRQILDWVANTDNKRIPIPHLLFTGLPGTGKTTIAKVLIKELGVSSTDVLEINASRDNSVDDVRNKIVNFCSTWAIGEYKVVFLDEADYLTQNAQAILRGEMERFSDSVRFILTGNYPHKIISALHSRVQAFHFDKIDLDSFAERMLDILDRENVSFEAEDLERYITSSYPDLRKCINLLDQNTNGGKLYPMAEENNSLDYMDKYAVLVQEGKHREAREFICSIAKQDDFEQIYRFFYKNLHLFSNTEEGQKEAILIIAQGLRNHSVCADSEINLAATAISLSRIED